MSTSSSIAKPGNPDTPSSPSKATTAVLPDIHLLCMLSKDLEAFDQAVAKIFPTLSTHAKITSHECALKYLPKDLRFDAVVSPANSYARLDGAFDDALARAYGPPGDYDWITRKAQKTVYEKWRGFAPPGTCTVVRLDHDDRAVPRGVMGWGDAEPKNPWGTEYLLLCPTMRVPQDVRWDREVVYECIWSLLCAVDNHNREVKRSSSDSSKTEKEIHSILITPLATGVGGVSARRWAEQCVLALKHWVEAVEDPAVWSHAGWGTALENHGEVVKTYKSET